MRLDKLGVESEPSAQAFGLLDDRIGSRVRHFQIRESLARGGMGEVYAGFDEVLKREVALKTVHWGTRLDSTRRERFLREARILSQLDDANICRIYDYLEEEHEDFLVLELIRGQPLSEVIADDLDPAWRMSIAQQITHALMVAHARGIVHRDLKPANVMLSEEGEVKVLDFGLAQSDMDEPPVDALAKEDRAAGQSSSSNKPAPAGVAGTVAYMSPEQLNGEQITPASDLYSLGIVLQELFTGCPAYPRDLGLFPLMSRVYQGETQEIEGVDADLAALLERLKSPLPNDRPTATETWHRLRWIQDKPRQRVRRGLVAVALLATTFLVTKYTVDLRQERARAIAERNRAENLIGFMLDDLTESLEPLGRLDLLDQVARTALEHELELPDAELSAEELDRRGRALHRFGRVLRSQGELDGALSALQQAQTTHLHVVEEHPESPDRVSHLANDYHELGWIYMELGELERAHQAFREAQSLRQRLVDRNPTRSDWLYALAYEKSAISSVLDQQGDRDGALAALLAARQLFQRVADREPENLEWRYGLAISHSHVGETFAGQGNWEAALKAFEAARSISRNLVEQEPHNTRWQLSLAHDEVSGGQALHSLGKLPEARVTLERAAGLGAQLMARDPSNVLWRYRHAVCQSALGDVLFDQKETIAALEAYRAAQEISRELTRHDPSSADWRVSLAWDNVSVASVLVHLDQIAEARDELLEARKMLAGLIEREGSSVDWLDLQVEIELELGDAWRDLGNSSAAREAWQRGLVASERLSIEDESAEVLGRYKELRQRLDLGVEPQPTPGA